MWSGRGSVNDRGESVLLLEPISRKPNKCKSVTASDAKTSFIGGTPVFYSDDVNLADLSRPTCRQCNKYMYLVLQMYAPLDDINLDRTMYVFACNSAACINYGFSKSHDHNNRFNLGGHGVVCCIRSQSKQDAPSSMPRIVSSEKKNAPNWDDDIGWGEEDDEWGTNNEDDCMNDIETMLAKLETEEGQSKVRDKTVKAFNKDTMDSSASENFSFPKFDLDCYDEPSLNKSKENEDFDSDDEDDFDTKEDSVQKLLSKYLMEEEDESILSAIKGNDLSKSTSQNGGDVEKYEKLPAEDRAFLAFSNRVKLAPKQSVRYAFDGVPLWSRPVPLTAKGKRGGQCRDTTFPTVPDCTCGSRRSFEFQVMPSVLHVLDVDKYSSLDKEEEFSNDLEFTLNKNHGGMNWGCIAVYSCAESCDRSHEEFVVVQESADGVPQRRQPITVNSEDEE